MSMRVWPNSSGSSTIPTATIGGRDSACAMHVTAESSPSALNTFENSIFASLISENEEKPPVNLKSDVISAVDLQTGSVMPDPANLVYTRHASETRSSNTYGDSTTSCNVDPVPPQLEDLALQGSSSNYAHYLYPPTPLYQPVLSASSMKSAPPQYFQSTPFTTANQYVLHQQQPFSSHHSYPSTQSFNATVYPDSSNYIAWANTTQKGISPNHSQVSTSCITEAPRTTTQSFDGRQCAVCEASATGIHYGAVCCDSCRSFFGAAIHLGLQSDCSIDHEPLRQDHHLRCHSCRLKKCFHVGMRKEAVHQESADAELVRHNGPGFCGVTKTSSSSTRLNGGVNLIANPISSGAVAATVKQIAAAEALVFGVSPVDLPEDKPLFNDLKDSGALRTDAQESVINIVLWSQNIPLFSDFSNADRFILLKASCIELLLVHFIVRLANSLSDSCSVKPVRPPNPPSQENSGSNTSVTPVESATTSASTSSDMPIAIVNALFPFPSTPEELLFSQQAERDLRTADRWHESRILMNLLPVNFTPCSTPANNPHNELNAQCLSRRLILRRIFDLALLFKRLRLSAEAVGCLRLVILFNPDAPGLTEETRERVEMRRDEAFICLEHTFTEEGRTTALSRMTQLCLHLADLSFLAERISSKTADLFPTFQCLVDILECFYESEPAAMTTDSGP